MSHSRLRVIAALSLVASAASAQEVIVTPTNSQGWAYPTTGAGATTTITNDQPRGTPGNQNGSLEFDGANGGRFRADYYAPNAQTGGSLGLLANLQSFGFDWFRSSTSTVGGIQAPAFRLYIRSNDPNTAVARNSELIWEYTYNGAGNAPVDAWQSVNTSLTNGVFWRYLAPAGTNGAQEVGCTFQTAAAEQFTTIQNWLNTCVGTNAVVYGISAGAGSFPGSGSFNGHVDNISLQFAGENQARLFNFETTAQSTVPEPATVVLMGSGLAVLGFFGARRRRSAK